MLVAACSSPPGGTATSSSVAGSSSSSAATSTTVPTAPPSTAPHTTTATSPPATTTPATPVSCATRIVGGMSADERAGQLIMVGLDVAAGRSSLDSLVTSRHLGGVILLGGWHDGASQVRATTRHLAGLASDRSTAGLGLLLAADQEGGAVQQLQGSGFSQMPSARQQNAEGPSALTADATIWAGQLRRAGINVNLAPVADTVPASIGTDNQPIGRFHRNFSSDPDRNSEMVSAFMAGMRAGGVASTVKHFPGLGRITGNTDVTSSGITDRVTTMDSEYLEPFRTGIQDGVELVMVGSAIYSRIDPGTNAVFSKRVISDLLRDRLSYDGVVVTDDVGAAKSVADVPVGQRATRFVRAGGDIVLTARPSTVPTMHDALTGAIRSDPAFAAQVQAAVTRVVDLKLRMGLAHC